MREGTAHANPQKGLCSWFQRIAKELGCAPAHTLQNKLRHGAARKLYKRDHILGNEQNLKVCDPLVTVAAEYSRGPGHFTGHRGVQRPG
jgi:hypothetical protein